jgi:hypothetical protein
MQVKTIITIACVVSSIAVSAYLTHKYTKSTVSREYAKSLSTYNERIKESDDKIQEILKSLPSEFYLTEARALQALSDGTPQGDILAKETLNLFALNGTNECASSPQHNAKFRCTEAEEAAVMYSVFNRFKNGKYKTLKDVILEKGQYSWTLNGLQTATIKTESFFNSLKIASSIISGSKKYEDSNFEQTHYCKSFYFKVDKNGRKQIMNGCGWHNMTNSLIPLGRMHVKDAEIPKVRILDTELSFHNFYKVRG